MIDGPKTGEILALVDEFKKLQPKEKEKKAKPKMSAMEKAFKKAMKK